MLEHFVDGWGKQGARSVGSDQFGVVLRTADPPDERDKVVEGLVRGKDGALGHPSGHGLPPAAPPYVDMSGE